MEARLFINTDNDYDVVSEKYGFKIPGYGMSIRITGDGKKEIYEKLKLFIDSVQCIPHGESNKWKADDCMTCLRELLVDKDLSDMYYTPSGKDEISFDFISSDMVL